MTGFVPRADDIEQGLVKPSALAKFLASRDLVFTTRTDDDFEAHRVGRWIPTCKVSVVPAPVIGEWLTICSPSGEHFRAQIILVNKEWTSRKNDPERLVMWRCPSGRWWQGGSE